MAEFAKREIGFTFIKLETNCNKMIPFMMKAHPRMQVTDLVNATKTKSETEVTKMFVDSASFILRATVGGKGKAADAKRKAASGGKPLWDVKQLAVGQNFSCISYLHVDNIEGDKITVKNHLGGAWFISKDLLVRDCWSADHFETEVKCSMTELSGILDCCRDTVFKVSFKKKIDQSHVEDVLSSMKMAELKNDAKLKPIIKGMIEGESCEITGHLIDVDNHLGRSVVVDLNAKAPHNIKQVDHRTIDYVILRNVKYSLGRKAAGAPEELPLKHDYTKPRWNVSKLAKGDWFSQVTYYKVKEIIDKDNVKVVTSKDQHNELTLSKDILLTEMQNGCAFSSTEKISRTEMVEKLVSAKESVMSIKFHKKLDDTWVKECLAENITKASQLNDKKHIKQVAKELISGRDAEMVCCLTSADGNLGRSSILDLNAPDGRNFRQVDHRALEELILNDKKYVLK